MARHLAIGETFQAGSIYFQNTNTAIVYFDKPFKNPPTVSIVAGDGSAVPFYRYDVKVDKFTIKVTQRFTGIVHWDAKEYVIE